MSEIIPFNDMKEMTRLMSKSVMLPKSLQEKPYDIFVILQMGTELGLKPMQSLNGINVIQGKPTIAPQTMLALIYQRITSPYIKFYKKGDVFCCDMARSKDDEVYTAEWGEKKARDMQLISKDNWKKQFENMCKWRCISEAARVVFPDVIQGFYTPEEIDENFPVEKEAPRQEPNQNEDKKEDAVEAVKNTFKSASIDLPDTSQFIDEHCDDNPTEKEREELHEHVETEKEREAIERMKYARKAFIDKVNSVCEGSEIKKNSIYRMIGLDKTRLDYTEADFKAFEIKVIELFADTSKQESLL